MAVIVVDEEGNQKDDKDVTVAPEAAQTAAPEPTQPPAGQPEAKPAQESAKESPAEDDIPQKFRGKSLKDVVHAYQQLEQVVGRQAGELGELRRTHDEFIRSTLEARKAQQTQNQPSEDEDSKFFLEPKKAVEELVAKHPAIQALYAQQAEAARMRAQQELAAKHPDWKEVVMSPDFASFVQSNSVYQKMLVQADREYDTAMADFVLSQFKEASRKAAAAATATRQAAVAAGTVPASGATAGTTGGKPVYSRAALIRKMQTDPEWYAANADEILAAYTEGRVR